MSYEHQQQVNEVAGKVVDVVVLLTDDTPDQQQIGTLLTDAMGIVMSTLNAISTESKRIYKLKFMFKCFTAVGNRLLDLLLPDSES